MHFFFIITLWSIISSYGNNRNQVSKQTESGVSLRNCYTTASLNKISKNNKSYPIIHSLIKYYKYYHYEKQNVLPY